MTASALLWRVAFDVPERAIVAFEAAFGPFALTVTSYALASGRWTPGESPWRLEFLVPTMPDSSAIERTIATVAGQLGIGIGDVAVTPLTEQDWIAAGLAQQPATHIGRFVVRGRHERGIVHPGKIAIEIEAGLAFGTGRHETTAGCLSAIARLARRRRFRRALDLGTGSGVLAIAIAKLGHTPVTAVEIDPVALRVARANVRVNGVAALVTVRDGDRGPARSRRGYDLIVANILLKPLARMARRFAQQLAPDGRLILAGILIEEEAALIAAYRAQGLALDGRTRRGVWPTLVFRRGGRGGRRAA
jgi:ribosomal protein L11 methyltransferase